MSTGRPVAAGTSRLSSSDIIAAPVAAPLINVWRRLVKLCSHFLRISLKVVEPEALEVNGG